MAEVQQDAARAKPVGYLLTTSSGEDQVVRRVRFPEAHPHVHIERRRPWAPLRVCPLRGGIVILAGTAIRSVPRPMGESCEIWEP
jgi:hypothetical protein